MNLLSSIMQQEVMFVFTFGKLQATKFDNKFYSSIGLALFPTQVKFQNDNRISPIEKRRTQMATASYQQDNAIMNSLAEEC